MKPRPPARSARRPIKRLLAALCLLALAAWPGIAAAQIGSDRYASFVVDAGSGTVLSSVNADEPRHPASLAKLMTLYMLFEALRDHRVSLQQALPVSAYAASMPPSKLGITPGMYMTVEDALLGLVTKSANDAAAAVAEMLGGDEDRFAAMMTLRARGLGMQRTVFRNASGLPDPDMWSTARDLAILARRILTDFPNYYGYFSTPSYEFRGRTVWNHDRMLQTYPGADGMKTGFTEASGHNLVTSASRGGVRLIGVVLGASTNPERDLHMAGLLDQGFEKLDVPTERRQPQMASRFALLSSAQAAPAIPQASAASPILRPADRTSDRGLDPARGKPPAPRWTIQVGSFATQAAARAAARAAEDEADSGEARVEPVTVRGKTTWRAQVGGLPQPAAQGACAQLARRHAACTVIRPRARPARQPLTRLHAGPSLHAGLRRHAALLIFRSGPTQGPSGGAGWTAGADARRITIHAPEDFEGMRKAGRLAAATLDMITPHVKPGVTTEALDRLCHDFMLAHGAAPAPLNYRGYPKSICTSINHVGLPRHPGRAAARGRRRAEHRRDGDPRRLARRHVAHVRGRRALDAREEPAGRDVRGDDARRGGGAPGRHARRRGPRDPGLRGGATASAWCATSAATASAAASTRRPNILHFGRPGRGPGAAAGNVLHHRADGPTPAARR